MAMGSRSTTIPLFAPHEIRILDGRTFAVSDESGDFRESKNDGLFHDDTRHLSKLNLKINGENQILLTSNAVSYFSAAFVLTNPRLEGIDPMTMTVIRLRTIAVGMHEEITVCNHNDKSVRVKVTLELQSDFADLFEVKAQEYTQRSSTVRQHKNSLSLQYEAEEFFRSTTLTFSKTPNIINANCAEFALEIPAKGEWELEIAVDVSTGKVPLKTPLAQQIYEESQDEMQKALRTWEESLPELLTDYDELRHAYKRSCIDLAALRLRYDAMSHYSDNMLPAAGLPWFMALFGRDTLISSYQAMICTPSLARTALFALADHQGKRVDNYTDEEPGKILHELRHGELSVLGVEPFGPNFGSVDATILFIILLSEYYRWTGDIDTVKKLKSHLLAALDWMWIYGDKDNDGFIEYESKSTSALRNQGWKDSDNAIQFSSGVIAKPPIALVEVQGYAYDALVRASELVRIWDDYTYSETLEFQASQLRKRFNDVFWIDSRGGFFALALDRDKRRVDARTSNIGHLLWSGIVDRDRAEVIARQLFSPEMFSGWGVRTLASDDKGFNPIGYHCGTVWPHDNSIIAAGLRNYDLDAEALRLAESILDAASAFEYRLPEAMAGFTRDKPKFPVRYPSTSAPQAWAAGATLLLIRTLLGLQPDLDKRTLRIKPLLPERCSFLNISGIHAFGCAFSVSANSNGQASVQSHES